METIKKMKYAAPTLEVVQIEMEEGIAGGSGASVTPGTPNVDDWGQGGGGSQNGDF